MTRLETGLLTAAVVLALLAGVTHLRASERADQLRQRAERAALLAADAAALQRLSKQTAPSATAADSQDVTQPFIAALRSAGVDPARVVSVLPQPPRRKPGSDLLETTHRVLLDGVELRSLSAALEELQRTAPWMAVTGIQLRAIPGSTSTWNVELGLTVSRYAPENRQTGPRN